MAEMMTNQIEKLTDWEIAQSLRIAAKFQREHTGITWEQGTDLVNIVAIHGDKLADALTEYVGKHDGTKRRDLQCRKWT